MALLQFNKNQGIQQQVKQNDPLDQAKAALYSDFVDGMKGSAVDVEISDEALQASIAKNKKLQAKRRLILIAVAAFLVIILFFGLYNTFIRHEWTGPEIAAYANYYNGKTNFPIYGLQSYLETHISDIFAGNMTFSGTVKSFSVKNPMITDLGLKTSELTNVYFTCDMVTNNSTNRVKWMLPIAWKNEQYAVAGDPILIATVCSIEGDEKQDNEFLSFKDKKKADDASSSKAKAVAENFFTLLYSGAGDLSTLYIGETDLTPMIPNGIISERENSDGSITVVTSDGKITYNGMVEWYLYEEPNKNGYNAYAKISISMPNGCTYQTEKYLLMESSQDGNWKIIAVL